MPEELKIPEGLQVAFGLQAQGHIPLILHKLADAGNWDDIGKAIGWHPETARRHFEWWIDAQTRATPAPAPASIELDTYDAGLLNDYGGGNVEWWHDYIRAELGRAHEFYQSQMKEGHS